MEPQQPQDQPVSQKIVIVEDNQSLAEIYKTRLEILGYTVFIGYNGITGLYFIQQEHPDLVLLDLMVPDIAGDQILQKMRASAWGKDIPVFIISNLNEADAPAGLRELGISGYAVKANLTDDQIDQIVNGILRPQTPLQEGHLDTSETSQQPSAYGQPAAAGQGEQHTEPNLPSMPVAEPPENAAN